MNNHFYIIYRQGIFCNEYIKKVINHSKKQFSITIIVEKAFKYVSLETAKKAALSFDGEVYYISKVTL